MKFSASFFILTLSIPFSLFAQNVDVNYIHQIISEIASDEYQGRETGTQGCTNAEEYVVHEFEKLKLAPAGENNTFYHHYLIPASESSVKATLKIDDRTFFQGYNEDFTLMYNSSWGQAEGEIVFAGYGIFNPERNRNDFDSLDIRDKIVLIKRGAPRNDISSWMPSVIDSVKAEYCYRNGAKAVLFFEPLIRNNPRILRQSYGNHLATVSVLPDFPVFSIDERVVRYIFTNAGQSYYRMMNLIETMPSSFATGRHCELTAKGKNTKPIEARNILGMIQGTDRELKKEFIVIGGHLDHVGMDDKGKVWNGADDNASGVAVALGIAKALRDHGFKPKRSIVFAAWTGEEMGLLGSKAWCENPTINLNKTVVYFNLDMVGLGNGKLNMPGTGFAPEVADFIKTNIDTSLLGNIVWSEGGPGGSDHNNFLSQGIPAFAGMTAGIHPDYHQPGDDADKIDLISLQHTGDIIYQSVSKISNTTNELLSAQRIDANRLRLFSFGFYNPVDHRDFRNMLKDKNFKFGIVNFSCANANTDTDRNFVSLIYALDSALNQNNGKYNISTTAYDAMMNRTGLLAAYNPSAIGYDELKFKVLSRLGYRLAIVKEDEAACMDTAIMKKLITLANQQGVGLILDGLDSVSLKRMIRNSIDPFLIINTPCEQYSQEIAGIIHSKGHIIVFTPGPEKGMENDYNSFIKLADLTGINSIILSPTDYNDETLKYLQKFIKQVDIRTSDKDVQYKITGDNFYNLAVRSLQAN